MKNTTALNPSDNTLRFGFEDGENLLDELNSGDGVSPELEQKLGDAFGRVGDKFDEQGRLIGGLAAQDDELDRKGLFRALKAMGVVASATLKTDELETIYEAEAKKRDDEALIAAQAAPDAPPPAAGPQPPAPAPEDAQKPAEG